MQQASTEVVEAVVLDRGLLVATDQVKQVVRQELVLTQEVSVELL